VLTVAVTGLGSVGAERARQILGRIPGITEVRFVEDIKSRPAFRVDIPSASQPSEPAIVAVSTADKILLRTPLLFEPLYADPRWPHFAASFQNFRGSEPFEWVGAVSFGESFPLYRRA